MFISPSPDIETSTLGWERLTNVDYLLHRYSDERKHPDIREDFDIFTGIWDDLSFPTVHPNFTLPSKPKRTRYVSPTDPDMCIVVHETKKKETKHTTAHHTHPSTKHHMGHHTTIHPSTKKDYIAGHHNVHKRELFESKDLPPLPSDSNERSDPKHGLPLGSEGGRKRRRYYRSVESTKKPPFKKGWKRDILEDSLSPIDPKDMSGLKGPAFLKSGEVISDLTPEPPGPTVWDWSSWQDEYEPQNETKWKFSEETGEL